MSASAARPMPRRAAGIPLHPSFFERATSTVARELLGAVLCTRTAEGITSGRIVETEAYLGEHDPASHAAAGRTHRTRWMYGDPGTAYVYFIYGAHWCVNAVTEAPGTPGAVLIRALEPLDGRALMRERRRDPRRDRDLTNGPGKLCAALGISGAWNGLPLDGPRITVREGIPVADADVAVTARIGITRAADWPLRWVVRESPFASVPSSSSRPSARRRAPVPRRKEAAARRPR